MYCNKHTVCTIPNKITGNIQLSDENVQKAMDKMFFEEYSGVNDEPVINIVKNYKNYHVKKTNNEYNLNINNIKDIIIIEASYHQTPLAYIIFNDGTTGYVPAEEVKIENLPIYYKNEDNNISIYDL